MLHIGFWPQRTWFWTQILLSMCCLAFICILDINIYVCKTREQHLGRTSHRFVYKHEIWYRCSLGNAESIFEERISRHSSWPPYWQNPKWLPVIYGFAITLQPKVIGCWERMLYLWFWSQETWIRIHILHKLLCKATRAKNSKWPTWSLGKVQLGW